MSLMQRIQKIMVALLMILGAVIMLMRGEDGYYIVAVILSVSLTAAALRSLIFYYSMARHMVGGKGVLYRGIILLDLGILTISVVNDPKFFVVLYLLVERAFSGAVEVMHALESRRYGAASWRLNMAEGILSIGLAAAALICGFILDYMKDVVYIYSSLLFYGAAIRIGSAFRKTAIVYIP